MSDGRRTLIAGAIPVASSLHEDDLLLEERPANGVWSPEAGEVLHRHPDPYRLAADWMLGTLAESEKAVLRAGARHRAWRLLIADLDRPETAADLRTLIDLAQCLVPGRAGEPELRRWAGCPLGEPPPHFAARLSAWLIDRGLAVGGAAEGLESLWRKLAGPETIDAFLRMRDRLDRLRKAAAPSAAEQCALHDYPGLMQRQADHEYAFSLSPRIFVVRRLRAWCRRSCRALRGSLAARLAGWRDEEVRPLLDLLECGGPALETGWRGAEVETPPRSPILIVTADPVARQYVKDVARHARTAASNDLRPFDRIADVRDERLRAFVNSCVVVVPDRDENPSGLVAGLRERLRLPRIIVLLRNDNDPALAWDLLWQGAYDVSVYPGGSVAHLREAIGQAANGAWRRPYVPICPDTHEFNPRPDSKSWAVVCPEVETGRTNGLDYHTVLRKLLPRCLGLHERAVECSPRATKQAPGGEKGKGICEFQEARPGSVADDLPDLVFAHLSAEPSEDEVRSVFLADMQTLENSGRRVVYLQRRAAARRLELPATGPSQRPIVRYHCATELLLRLAFGFGASLPAPDALTELCDHDTAHRPD